MATFEELRKEQMLFDALLNVAGVQFPAHKLVLCSCSTYFKALFTNWSSPDRQDFDISDVSADIMEIILDYCYTQVVHITPENIQALFIAADFLGVSGITQACCQVMKEQLSPSNCIAVWGLTNQYHYPELKKQVFSYILKHFEDVVSSSEEFLHLSREDLCSIIDEDQLNVKEESTVFEAVLRWVSHAPQERITHLANLLTKVRLALVPLDYFFQQVQGNNLLQNNRECMVVVIRIISVMLDARVRESNVSLSSRLARPRLPQALLLSIGGWSGANPVNNIEVYDNHANRWVAVANNDRTPRAYHGTVFLNGCVYLIGGFDGVVRFNTTHKYDLANHTWQEVAPMHSPRCYVSVALLDGLIYAMGGHNGDVRLETVERYSPETNQWTMISPMNEQRSDANSTAYDGKIYICGGFNGEQVLDTAECYNPLTDQWTMISNMTNRRSGVSVIAYANEIYAVGGFSGMARLNTMEAYNPRTNTWRPLPDLLYGRSNFSIGVVDERLYVVGGFNGSTTINRVECFDVKTGVWSEVQNMEISRSALSCSVAYDLPNMADYAAPRPALPDDDPTVE
ncbi:kelch-like protein 10 [Periophthalmus magnuspinnatus]|uniref:kelch-like protein 10 n=1 Tax=Periophthalmus magnuspinnatus TaxID=409849 RepID=UPI00145BBF3F|nr:kelch-like protein 10 [Periophthalmus magnuspinnatus]